MSYIGIGSIGKYDPESEDFNDYIERVTHFMIANNITQPNRKTSMLLTVIGSDCFSTVKSIISPAKPEDHTFQQLVEILREHYAPRPSVVMSRFKFRKRLHLANETIASYIAALRKLAETCDFGANLNDMLRDQLVASVNDASIQKALLNETDQTFPSIYKKALSMEKTAQEIKEMKEKSTTSGASSKTNETHEEAQVNKVNFQKRNNFGRPSRNSNQGHQRQPPKQKQQEKQSERPFNGNRQSQRQEPKRDLCYRCKRGRHDPDKCWHKKE